MTDTPVEGDVRWKQGDSSLVISPRQGGRVLSWRYRGQELVMPLQLLEGGLLRVLFAEEQYPGSSFLVPHHVVPSPGGNEGMELTLRHRWNTSARFMRQAGWSEKANELQVDDLLLAKTIRYDAVRHCLLCSFALTNLGSEPKYLTPWLHSAFLDWPSRQWVVLDGASREYRETDIYWGAHEIGDCETARLIQCSPEKNLYLTLGAATPHLRGLSGLLPVPGEFAQSTTELRYQTLLLAPGSCWQANFFLALSDHPEVWVDASPEPLYSRIVEAVKTPLPTLEDAVLLSSWMLPTEARRGFMVLSFLDKPPFSSAHRYGAAHSFSHFQQDGATASAHVMLYAPTEVTIRVRLNASDQWSLEFAGRNFRESEIKLGARDFVPLVLKGRGDQLTLKEVTVGLTAGSESVLLGLSPEATIERQYPYAVRQAPAYFAARHSDSLGPSPSAARDEFLAWQERQRRRAERYLEHNANGRCDPEPRLLERQEGPSCTREKWLVQTEPGIWVPGFLIKPRGASGRLPLLYHLHGSGPGKDGYAPDEVPAPVRSQLHHELEYMPYALAAEFPALVWVPDGRGQGEMGETNPANYARRGQALGVSNWALRLWDQMRALDWLLTRDDVDPGRIGSCGCSGGGGMTYLFAAADERVGVAVVSSTSAPSPVPAPPEGFFQRMFGDAPELLPGALPLQGAPGGMLIAPRPLWIVDGRDDLGIAAGDRPAWRAQMQQGRDQIRTAYQLLDAEDNYRDEWLDGGHCAGMTNAGVLRWFRRWWP